jgi:hypothetical protein
MLSSSKKALMANALANRSVTPIGIDLDGTNDYGSLGVDLTGNADGKTFTFSCWVYADPGADGRLYMAGSQRFYTNWKTGKFEVIGLSAAGTMLLNVTIPGGSRPEYENRWIHVLISVDLNNTSNRYVYFDDEDFSAVVSWNTYINDNLDFTNTTHFVGAQVSGAGAFTGRLAGLYLDYTYRDLSDSANRRLFIDAEGRYVTPPTSGIISMPMDDPTNPYRNDGTGQDFTANGTVARSGRGPNQYNPAASSMLGSGDYLFSASIGGAADSKTLTFVFTVKLEDAGNGVFQIGDGLNGIRILNSGSIRAWNAAGTEILNGSAPAATQNSVKYRTIAISINLADAGQRQVNVDGIDITGDMTWSIYTNDTMDLTRATNYVGAVGELSDVWFTNSYTADLSGFFDTGTGKAKYLGADGSTPTGSQPLIYLPMRGDDAGNNLGSGGDFTVNSGPYTGARGPNEFWAESMQGNGSTQFLKRSSSLTGAVAGGVFSAVWAMVRNTSAGGRIFHLNDSSSGGEFYIEYNTAGTLAVIGKNSANTTILNLNKSSLSSSGVWELYQLCIDLSDTGKRHLYKNSSEVTSITWNNYTDDDINFTVDIAAIAGAALSSGASDWWPGKIGFLYFSTEYIDFSQEANRLKFFDAYGYPVDLGADGSTPTGTAPLIYMNEGFHLGTNLGTGGNFTPNNAPTDGGFVKG